MLLDFDTTAQALDISLSDAAVARTVEIDSGTLVDLDEGGRVVSIEVIHPSRQWPLGEILERFELATEDAAVLTSLWRENAAFPFGAPAIVAEEAIVA
jgi:uncharacterized protein YuzE